MSGNKAIYLHCRDAQACISFAGVARIKGTPTSDFIANHLGGANVSEMLFNQVVRELEGPVIEALRQQEMDWQLPHLSMLVLSGYQYSGLPGPKQKISSVHGCIATGHKAPWTEVFSAEGRENIRVFGKTQAVEDSLKEHIIGLSRQSFFQTSDAAAVADQHTILNFSEFGMVFPERQSFSCFWPVFLALARWSRGPQRPRPLGASERSDPRRTGPNELTQATLLTQTAPHLATPTMFSFQVSALRRFSSLSGS